ncbi:hypothetical protein HK101_003955 [Irineochytrium annulatum]|nr:hypothetical protein HK101_003955 [Irineochytrium annulatum]
MPMMRTKDETPRYFCALCDDPVSPYPPVASEPVAPSADTHGGLVGDTSNESSTAVDPSDLSDELDMYERFIPSAERERERELADRASALLGQKLLSGWTMLADSCTRTEQCVGVGVPLMRRGTITLCVLCEHTTVAGGEAVAGAATSTTVEAASALAPSMAKSTGRDGAGPSSTTVAGKRASGDDRRRAAPDDEEPVETTTVVEGKEEKKKKRLEEPAKRTRTAGETKGSTVSASVSSGKEEMIVALLEHMSELKSSLELSSGPLESVDICRAIEACAGALKSVNAI